MKTVKVSFSENLLAELDRTSEVQAQGRSAVLRGLTRDFLRQRREREIDAQYERAYAGAKETPGQELEDWVEAGQWPPG